MDKTYSKKILIVDDDIDFARLCRLKLTLDGFLVVVVSQGKDISSAVTTNTPDLIFLDLKMPDTDGFEVLKKLKKEKAANSMPVVILSNFDDQDLVEKALSLGATDYWLKYQLTPEEISTKANNLLN